MYVCVTDIVSSDPNQDQQSEKLLRLDAGMVHHVRVATRTGVSDMNTIEDNSLVFISTNLS